MNSEILGESFMSMSEFEMMGDDDKKIHSAEAQAMEGGEKIEDTSLDSVVEELKKEDAKESKAKKGKQSKDDKSEIKAAKAAKMQDPAEGPEASGEKPKPLKKNEFAAATAQKMQDDEEQGDDDIVGMEDEEEEEGECCGECSSSFACKLKEISKKIVPAINSIKEKVMKLFAGSKKEKEEGKDNSKA
ncbi:hypothetical protein [Mycoplasma suis]|nr:hypothetical protein [Mycoplasma suis]